MLRLAAVRQLTFLRCFDQPRHLLLQTLRHHGHVIDRNFHLLVVALVGLRDQLVDLAAGNLRENAIALTDGKQYRIQHLVDTLDHFAMYAIEDCRLAPFGEPSLSGRVH